LLNESRISVFIFQDGIPFAQPEPRKIKTIFVLVRSGPRPILLSHSDWQHAGTVSSHLSRCQLCSWQMP